MPAYRRRIRVFRRTKPLLWSGANWRRRLIVWTGAVAVGVAAAGFARAAVGAEQLFDRLLAPSRWLALVVCPGGFLLLAFVSRRFFPGAQGSGIPQVIAARDVDEPGLLRRLLSLRIAAGKILLTTAGLALGASIGREGPTVQVSAALMLAFGAAAGLKPRQHPVLILAGGAAGVAAAFNTPIAGLVFAIEELARGFERRHAGLILGTIVLATAASVAILGNGSYFGRTGAELAPVWAWAVIPLIAVAGGLLGGLFSRIVVWLARNLGGLAGGWPGRHPLLLAGLCGLAVALLGLASDGATYGTGYAQAQQALAAELPHPAGFVVLKLLANLVAQISAIPGGFFAPSLSVGAGLGATFGQIFPAVPAGALVILGMASFFAAVVQAPITGFVIVFEMTSNDAMMLPLIMASLIACGTARLIAPEPLYHTLAAGFLVRLREMPQPKGT